MCLFVKLICLRFWLRYCADCVFACLQPGSREVNPKIIKKNKQIDIKPQFLMQLQSGEALHKMEALEEE